MFTLASKWQAQLEQEEKGMKVSEKGVESMESLKLFLKCLETNIGGLVWGLLDLLRKIK